MSMPRFDKKYLVLVESWVGDADHYAVDTFEVDDLKHAEVIYDLGAALGRNYAPNPTVDGENGFGGRGFTDANLQKLYDALRLKHGAAVDALLRWEGAPDDMTDVEILRENIGEFFASVGEGYYDMNDYWRTVEQVKLVRLDSVEVIK
ncbi:hypothetical protein SmaMPs15_000209 [Stenotrophomonas maltophilia phage vB_SmaM_Ps15]|uniref:Uncharacterized protein n=1 Tax=Stenotrophomonas maltophilia phage vB_SmaM_Ps15 TaxID=3071007 RepID=A0AAE9FLV5_9CAUD|nr:hypothetical protein PQC01_gp269 [Stenotrophomonas maltophilia phage vB_SmaM_Ps15]UMO77360.1 hypothetical protein SmaMPs15_000209 [Stenotrophomonas maltophilia phage vB_SmaM_Ps15]